MDDWGYDETEPAISAEILALPFMVGKTDLPGTLRLSRLIGPSFGGSSHLSVAKKYLGSSGSAAFFEASDLRQHLVPALLFSRLTEMAQMAAVATSDLRPASTNFMGFPTLVPGRSCSSGICLSCLAD